MCRYPNREYNYDIQLVNRILEFLEKFGTYSKKLRAEYIEGIGIEYKNSTKIIAYRFNSCGILAYWQEYKVNLLAGRSLFGLK
jgi:hypothetical protein